MSTQADHGHELVPRPEQTPDALRAALAVVAPGRLPEMQQTGSTRLSWAWEYAFGAEEAARTAPPVFLTAVERKAAELVRAAEAQYLHGRASSEGDPRGGDIAVPGGMFTYLGF
ncbi:hypothetical protein [Streptomyces sp. NPDC057375]|uniref:hypothetical protein n=1 Tax=Streptomyces sp. NPDC057375 TaxID=3346109 RepID=UPI003633527E